AYLDGLREEVHYAGRDLDRPGLALDIDEPVARERLLRLGERAVGRDRQAVLDTYRPRLARVGEAEPGDELTGRGEIVLDRVHELDHLGDPLLGLVRHRGLVAEHHDHVLHCVLLVAVRLGLFHNRVGVATGFSTASAQRPRG